MAKDLLRELVVDKEKLEKIFEKNDITKSVSSKFNEKLSKKQMVIFTKAKKFVSQYWIKGLKKADVARSLKYYSDDFPIKLVGNADANFIAKTVTDIASNEEKLKIAEELFEIMFGDRFNTELLKLAKSKNKSIDDLTEEETDKFIDEFADNINIEEIGGMIIGQKIPKLAETAKENMAEEDFNKLKNPNLREEDFYRRWYHFDTAHPTLPDPELAETIHEQNPNTEDKAIANVSVERYLATLSENDKKIIEMLLKGYTQKEIAKAIGFSNNSGISKRIANIKKSFTEATSLRIKKYKK